MPRSPASPWRTVMPATDHIVGAAALRCVALHLQNGLETDVDCGGTACPKCRKGATCKISADCTGVCNKNKKCEQANCR
jgi:hypothetical protein